MSDVAARSSSPDPHPPPARSGRFGEPPADDTRSTEQYWEDLYNDSARVVPDADAIWSSEPNELLVRWVGDLAPGTALDVGCGEGGDAVWLARQGWQVTGVDVSPTALRRAAAGAAQHGVTDRVRWQQLDLSTSFPEGRYDLVSAQYFHSFVAQAGERVATLRRAAAAVAPGGVLLVVGHQGWPSWAGDDHPHVHLPGTAEVRASLGLSPGDWTVEVEELVVRPVTSPDGEVGTRTDNVLCLRRRA